MVAAAQKRSNPLSEGSLEPFDAAKLEWFRRELRAWGSQHRRNFPWRSTQDPYAILVAEFLLQKTNAAKVAPVYEEFLARYPTPEALAAASVEEVTEILQPLGLVFRGDRLIRSMQRVVENFGGKIPDTEAELLDLPGVGHYIARSVCAHAYLQPKAVLDTNVARILERFFGFTGSRVKSRSRQHLEAAERAAPETEVGAWNLALLDFGAAVCTARNPHCAECPLQQQCSYFQSRRDGSKD